MAESHEAREPSSREAEEESVAVCIRVRPLLANETSQSTHHLEVDSSGKTPVIRVKLPDRREKSIDGREKEFSYDFIQGQAASQSDVFEGVRAERLVGKFVDGFNCTIFAYGQTGSGKTYTMEGLVAPGDTTEVSRESSDAGLVPRCLISVFKRLEKLEHQSYRVRCSFVQIYNEVVYDLLQPRGGQRSTEISVRNSSQSLGQGLRMRYNNVDGFFLENLTMFECGSVNDALGHFKEGVRFKQTGSHRLNEKSSRSHCLFTLYLDANDPETNESASSKFTLVDLAGSERVSITGATGRTFVEATHINTSLFVLRTVITNLAQKQSSESQQYVPYRDSKLTSLLQNCIGGDAYTLMIACISPGDDHCLENLSTLAYAAKASTIRSAPTRSEDAKSKTIRLLRAEIELLKKQLKNAQRMSLLGSANEANPVTPDATVPEPSIDPKTRRLKEKLLDSINLIKSMHTIEKDLRIRMEGAEQKLLKVSAAHQRLLSENQKMREHEHMLLELLDDDSKRSGQTKDATTMLKKLTLLQAENAELKDNLQVYATMNRTPANDLRTKPSRKPKAPTSTKPTALPNVRHSQTHATPPSDRILHGLGHLSVNQLRDLLSAKRSENP